MKYTIAMLFVLSAFGSPESICGRTDDRVLSNNLKIGRASSSKRLMGCTATLIGRSCAISAGHCVDSLEKISFNVPNSTDTNPNPSAKEDTYFRTKDFLRYKSKGPGQDWAVIRILPNKHTGLYPGDVQGFYDVDLVANLRTGAKVSITGFGKDQSDPIRNFAQQTHSGNIKELGSLFNKSKLTYTVDTMGGNSGSSVIAEDSNKIIGVHSHGYCSETGGQNEGTLIAKNPIFKKVIEQCLRWENSL